MKTFKDFVNEELDYKKAREITSKIAQTMHLDTKVSKGDYSFECGNQEIKANKENDDVIVEITNNTIITFKGTDFKGNDITITYKVPLLKIYRKSVIEENNKYTLKESNKVLLEDVELIQVLLNDKSFKLDKKTRITIENRIKKIKNRNVLLNLKEKVDKQCNTPEYDEAFLFPEVQKVFNELKEKIKNKNKKIEDEYTNIEKKIARKAKTNYLKVVAVDEDNYAIFMSELNDKKEIRKIIMDYDNEAWASEDFEKTLLYNDYLLRKLSEIGHGTLYFVSNPMGKRVENSKDF